MKYYENDIVEVINLQKYYGEFNPKVGQRYYVTGKPFINGGSPNNLVAIIGAEEERVDVDVLNVTLYKRPLINKIKALFE